MTLMSSGDMPPNPREKPGYRLEFDESFASPTLDTSKWLPYYLPQWSSRQQAAANYRIENHMLHLEITEDQAPWCPEFDGEVRGSVLQTGVYAGPLDSPIGQSRFNEALVVREAQDNQRLYTPQFGYIETRVKASPAGGVHVSLWTIGYEEVPAHSAEICLFELLGNEAGEQESTLRYGLHQWFDPAIDEDMYQERLPIDSRDFHIYAVDWTADHVDFYVDNQKIRRIEQSPQYPSQLMLGLFELPFEGGWNGPFDPQAAYPKTFTVDYVRGYRAANSNVYKPKQKRPC